MHGICMWFLSYDMSLSWRNALISSGLISLVIFLIAMVLWVSFLSFLVGSHVPLVVG